MSALLSLSAALALARACAPQVAPETLLSLVQAESGLNPFTIGINDRPHRALHPSNPSDAVHEARMRIAQGQNLDLGLAQINVRNLRRLGLSVQAAFDPCQNLAAGARVLTQDYLAAQPSRTSVEAALGQALSLYNTGDPARGFRNGYVAAVYRAAAQIVPALSAGSPSSATTASELGELSAPDVPAAKITRTQPQALDVFARNSTPEVWAASPPAADAAPAAPSPTPPSVSGDPL